MQANIVDLRYRMKDVIQALDKNQRVTILYRGKVKATIVPASVRKSESVRTNPFFGMYRADLDPKSKSEKSDIEAVDVLMDKLRGVRD